MTNPLFSDNSHERARIEFSRGVEHDEFQKMFKYLGNALKAEVSYTTEIRNTVGIGRYNQKPVDRTSYGRLSGTLARYGDITTLMFDTTQAQRREKDIYTGIQFFIIPGYDNISEVNPKEVELMDESRKCIADYFLKNK
ncbi:hypothetical protein KW787_01635 [Candidatus Pacearchaeota archaeon]|nr:hypothetical protein [Candidatus Pacearchaeota archaeon]